MTQEIIDLHYICRTRLRSLISYHKYI